MKNTILVLLVIAFNSSTALAENVLSNKEESQDKSDIKLLQMNQIGVSNGVYYRFGNKIDDDDVEELLKAFPSSRQILGTSDTYHTLGWVTLSVGFFLTYASIVMNVEDYNSWGKTTDPTITDPTLLVSIGAITVNVVAIRLFMKSTSLFYEAIDAFNEEVKDDKYGRSIDIDFQLGLTGAGVTVRF